MFPEHLLLFIDSYPRRNRPRERVVRRPAISPRHRPSPPHDPALYPCHLLTQAVLPSVSEDEKGVNLKPTPA
jgi:hypothetical protein